MFRVSILGLFILLLYSCTPINDAIIFNNDIKGDEAVVEKIVKKKKAVTYKNRLMVDNFNRKNRNSLKGNVNPWDFKPQDSSQSCRIRYTKKVKMGTKGSSLKVMYDVDSPNQAFNGVYSELKNIDISSFNFTPG